jgi:hypothetical protein
VQISEKARIGGKARISGLVIKKERGASGSTLIKNFEIG